MSINNISFLTLFGDGENLEVVRGNTHTFTFYNLKTKTGEPYNYSWNLRAYNDDPKLGAISQSDSGTLTACNQTLFSLTLDFPGDTYLLNSKWTLALQLEDSETNQIYEGGQVTITISKDSVDNAGQEIINNVDPGNLIRSTTLTGLNTELTGTITATDTILTGFGRVQNQIIATKTYIDTNYVPYTGATANVDLGTRSITATNQVIKSSGTSNDAVLISASDGSRLARFNETSGGHGWFEVDNNAGTAVFLARADGGNSYLSTGNFGLGTTSPTSTLDINGTNGHTALRMRTTYTPTSTSDTNGSTGQFAWDDNYLYLKTSTGWKRSTALNSALTNGGVVTPVEQMYFTVGRASSNRYVTDGTDDDVQINQAITDASVAGGGTVYLTSPVYSGGTITMRSNVALVGLAFTTYNAKNSSLGQVITNITGASNFSIADIFLNANSCSYGIILSSFTNAYVNRVKISNSTTRAGHFEEGTNIKVIECEARLTTGEGLIFYTNLRDSWLVNNLVDGATSYGLRASGGGQNNLVAGNTIMNGGTGIFMRSSIDKFVRIVHNNIINCTNGIELNSNSTTPLTSKALIANNTIEGKTATGVGIDLTVTAGVGNNRDHTIVNNNISNFAIGYRQLTTTSGISENIISGNKIMTCSAQAMVLYNSDSQINNNLIDTASTGIDIYSGSNWNTIVGNKILGVTTGIQERTGANYNNIQCNTVNASGTKISKTGANSISANNLTN